MSKLQVTFIDGAVRVFPCVSWSIDEDEDIRIYVKEDTEAEEAFPATVIHHDYWRIVEDVA